MTIEDSMISTANSERVIDTSEIQHSSDAYNDSGRVLWSPSLRVNDTHVHSRFNEPVTVVVDRSSALHNLNPIFRNETYSRGVNLAAMESGHPARIGQPTDNFDTGATLAYVGSFLRLTECFRQIISAARGEIFHDGMRSQLAEDIHSAIIENGVPAVDALRHVLNDCRGPAIMAVEEILRQVGLLEHPPTQRHRLQLLADMLASDDGGTRDGALLGLSFMEDPSTLPYLRAALQREVEPWLVEGISQVIEELEQAQCLNT